VKPPTDNLIESIPPASAVRESLCATLHHVQLLRALLRLAERKERKGTLARHAREEVESGR
jgi:hypothetical protein